MYSLDEVDAVLDLSHTQNIVTMDSTHFSNSQFIIVSLNGGMFIYANVTIRPDGISAVVRTVSGGKSRSLLTTTISSRKAAGNN
eukprot:gene19897-20403_t